MQFIPDIYGSSSGLVPLMPSWPFLQYVCRGMQIFSYVASVWGPSRLSPWSHPILFIVYTADLVALIDQHGLCARLYADDTQIGI